MNQIENIILVGAMGAGKSTIGRKLANKLSKEFFDSDKVIEKKTGVDIATIFEYENEIGFRAREEKVIHELCQLRDIVLATGGGAILSSNTREILSKSGTIFYLQASIDTLLKRTNSDVSRPLLNNSNKKETIANLLKQREPLYRDVAHHIIETDRHTVSWAVNQIIKNIDKNGYI